MARRRSRRGHPEFGVKSGLPRPLLGLATTRNGTLLRKSTVSLYVEFTNSQFLHLWLFYTGCFDRNKLRACSHYKMFNAALVVRSEMPKMAAMVHKLGFQICDADHQKLLDQNISEQESKPSIATPCDLFAGR